MKIPVIRQHDSSDCGAACIASVCAYYGKEISIVKLRELLDIDVAGATVKGMAEAMNKLDFDAKAIQIDPDVFTEGFTLPAIARIVRNDGTTHFVVIYKIKSTRHKDNVWVMDPAEDKVQKKTVAEFYEDFDGIAVLGVPSSKNAPCVSRSTTIFFTAPHSHTAKLLSLHPRSCLCFDFFSA